MNRKCVVLILAVLLCSGCMGEGTNQSSYNVGGRVLVSGSQVPLSNVELILDPAGKVEVTDSSGRVAIQGLKGTVKVTPFLDGWTFTPSSRTVSGGQGNLEFMASESTGETTDETTGFVVLKPSIYGDREGAEGLDDLLIGNYSKFAFGLFHDRRDKGIFVHIIGDMLSNQESKGLYGVELQELDEKTNAEGIFLKRTMLYDQPCLLISVVDLEYLRGSNSLDGSLREEIDWIMEVESSIPVQTHDLVWISSGYESRVFGGLFKNPDYSNLSLLLEEDGLTLQTPQVKEVAKIINDKQDLSTLKEIYSLLSTFSNANNLGYTFEVTASRLLSNGVLSGCTTLEQSWVEFLDIMAV